MNDLENKFNEIETRVKHVNNEAIELIHHILVYCMNEIDFEYAEKLCRLYVNSTVDNFVYIGMHSAMHVARIYGRLVDKEIIQEIIHIANGHTRIEYKEDAKDELGWMQAQVDYDIYSLYDPSAGNANNIDFKKKQFYEKGKSVNPQSLFHLRVQVLPDRPRQYAADGENSRAVVIDEYLPGKYCYHFRKYSELSYNLAFNDQLIVDKLPDEEDE